MPRSLALTHTLFRTEGLTEGGPHPALQGSLRPSHVTENYRSTRVKPVTASGCGCCRCSHPDVDVEIPARKCKLEPCSLMLHASSSSSFNIRDSSSRSWRPRPRRLTLAHVEMQPLRGNIRCHLHCWTFNQRNGTAAQVCDCDSSTPFNAVASSPSLLYVVLACLQMVQMWPANGNAELQLLPSYNRTCRRLTVHTDG